MKWASALSKHRLVEDSVAECAAELERGLGGLPAHLVVVFASPDLAEGLARLPELLRARFPDAVVLGCTGGGVIGGGREVEEGDALSLTAANLPGVTIQPFHLEQQELPEPDAPATTWHQRLGLPPDVEPSFLLLADPFTFEADALISGLDRAYPGAPKMGGLASGGLEPGEHQLFVLGTLWRSGAAGVALWGDLSVHAIVAQGCRPIGRPMLVTGCKRNLVLELDQRKPLDVLGQLYESLDEDDQELFRHSLFVGIELSGGAVRMDYGPGDFLVRNLIGVDPHHGSMAVAAVPRQFQVLQFHLRDARTAEEDLELHLKRFAREVPAPAGALLFSCMGRGEHLFGCPDHDSAMLKKLVADIPVGGFFGNGEIGPVCGRTFLHGYTSAFAIFTPKVG